MRSRTQPEPVNAYLPSRVGINGVEDHDKRYDELPQNYLHYLTLQILTKNDATLDSKINKETSNLGQV